MGKALLGAVVGVFVGAFVVEILNRKKPGLTKNIESKAKNTVDAFVSAYKEGYHTTDEPEKQEA